MVIRLKGKPDPCATKVFLANWFPETTLDLFTPWLFFKSLSWLQIWWEASQRACPQPPVGRTGLACTLQMAWRELQGVGDGHGKETAQKKHGAWASSSPLPAGAGSARPLTRGFRTLNRWLKHQSESFQTSQKAKNLVWTPTEIFHSGAL